MQGHGAINPTMIQSLYSKRGVERVGSAGSRLPKSFAQKKASVPIGPGNCDFPGLLSLLSPFGTQPTPRQRLRLGL
jgi:hypothetical protein